MVNPNLKQFEQEALRLQVFLQSQEVGSRRKCEDLITARRVTVNGSIATKQGMRVSPEDKVLLDGKHLTWITREKLYFMMHKPRGFLCSQKDALHRPCLFQLFPKTYQRRLFHVGRLDFNSSGIILYTNDGNWANKVMHPSFGVEKEYRVVLHRPVHRDTLEQFMKGVMLAGQTYRLQTYRLLSPYVLHMVLQEGKNREIRRFFSSTGQLLKSLQRIRIGSLVLRNLPPGHFRKISAQELSSFNKSHKIVCNDS